MAPLNWNLHHVNLNAYRVADSVAFFETIIGLDGGRPRTAVMGNRSGANTDAYLFGEATDGLHLSKPDLTIAQKHGVPINPTLGGHVAITVKDLAAVKRRLDAAGIVYSDFGSWAIPGLLQIYVCDPAMNVIEVNQFE